MKQILLAIRNLTRNRRRTLTALATIGFGVIAMVQAAGFIEWIFWAMRSHTIESRLGHIQVVKTGYFKDGTAEPFAYLVPEEAILVENLEREPAVKAVTPRLKFNGLLSFGENTISFIAEGVDPISELTVNVVEGEGLSIGTEGQVILGRGLARNVGAGPGDKVTLLVNTAFGGINAAEVSVAGLFITSSKLYDDSVLRIPISLARGLARASGAHTWVVLLDDTDRTDEVLARFRAMSPDNHSDLQFVPWYELAEFYNKTVVLFSRQIGIVRIIIALIIVLSISNILVMNVLERTSEIGTLLAIGHRRRKIMSLFLSEGLLLGLFGGAIGLLLGIVLAEAVSAIGIPMPPPPGMDEGFTGEILVTWPLALESFSLAVAATVASAVYPAWKASRLQIVNALRHNK